MENQRRTSSRPDSPVVVLTFAFRDKNTPLTPGCEISPAPGYTDIQMSSLGRLFVRMHVHFQVYVGSIKRYYNY